MKQVTQKDIARVLNVSQCLVAGVLSGRGNTRASHETRHRITTTAREMGYYPNHSARSLRQGRTMTVALVVLRPDNAFRLSMALLIQGLTEQLSEYGYSLMVRVHREQQALLTDLESLSAGRPCDAIVLCSLKAFLEEQGLLLEQRRMPFVVKGRFERDHPKWHQVEFDHEGMIIESVRVLREQNRTRIAYIGFPPYETFAERLEEQFRACVSEPVAVLQPCTHEETVEAVSKLYAASPEKRPDAFVVGSSGGTWLSIEEALIRRGIRVGFHEDEVAIVGIAASEPYPLRIGEGLAFGDNALRFDRIGEEIARYLEAVLCHNTPPTQPIRILSPLSPTQPHWDTLVREALINLTNHGDHKE